MRTFLLQRLLALIPTLFFASIVVFMAVRVIPGSVIDLMLSQNDLSAAKLSREALEEALGLHRPMHEQYARWAGGILLRGDLGQSLWQGTPVAEMMLNHLPVTLELGALALAVSLLFGVPIGVYSAIRQDTAGDHAGRTFSILMLAVPGFWLGTLVMVLPSIWWGWVPETRYVSLLSAPAQNLQQLFIPSLILGGGLSAYTMRLTRTMVLEVMRQDYVRTAWAKGLPARQVIVRHALRNALLPVVTLVGLQAPLLVGGSIVMEQIFVIPGMGRLLLQAVSERDYPVISGVFLLVGLTIILINLLVDVSYGLIDPRVRYD